MNQILYEITLLRDKTKKSSISLALPMDLDEETNPELVQVIITTEQGTTKDLSNPLTIGEQ